MIEFDEVRLVDVSRHFGRRRAVSQISLTARSGDILGLLGPNGAGKSTLIGMLATLVAPTSGSVTFGGQPARALGGPLRKTIGLLAHELHLYTELSARPGSAIAETKWCPGSRAGCASGWRSSAR